MRALDPAEWKTAGGKCIKTSIHVNLRIKDVEFNKTKSHRHIDHTQISSGFPMEKQFHASQRKLMKFQNFIAAQ
jgi:hypothetical protein